MARPALIFSMGQNFGNGPAENADIVAVSRMIGHLQQFQPLYRVYAVLNVTQANRTTLSTTLNALRDNGIPFLLDVYSSDVLTNSRAQDVYDVQHGIPLSPTDLLDLKASYGPAFAGIRVFEVFAMNFTVFACKNGNNFCSGFSANLPSDTFFQASILEPFMQFARDNGMFVLFEDPYWFFDHQNSNPLLQQAQNEQDLKTLLTSYPGLTTVMYANNEAHSQSVPQFGLWQSAMRPFVAAGAKGMGVGDQAWICSADIGISNETDCPVNTLISWAHDALSTGSIALETEPYWYWWDLPKGQIELPTGVTGASAAAQPTLTAFAQALGITLIP